MPCPYEVKRDVPALGKPEYTGKIAYATKT
jgi:hypothetical protein